MNFIKLTGGLAENLETPTTYHHQITYSMKLSSSYFLVYVHESSSQPSVKTLNGLVTLKIGRPNGWLS